ncbi:TetR/AcrR family transcriptional regulator [Kutzneria sp. CA-103260]|uniref:TetR/AcrR family transcriptional regulator n=1 Tax=Kutzneria sp. CA-103260 TaxID=2802641 RepID=UPI001BAAE4EC|nr:TetR/AcrR family transcriptional regulator [Kutzneria sp. CA-103260]QUQ62302.1 TetR family transcriptional regulator [Kutzneria sp. CA-103260]
MPSTETDEQPRLGLRERKKLMAKRALRTAALELFATQGYEATTVDDIADRADVSRASFFRYFNAKEDVLTVDDEERRRSFLAVLEQQRAKSPARALRQAILTHAAEMDESSREETLAYTKIMLSSRVVLGQAYENRIKWLRDIEQFIRGRLADDADADVIAPLLADAALGVLETATRLAAENPERSFEEVVDVGFRMIRH